MSRLRLKVDGKFLFSCELTVRAADLNYGNHMGNDSVVRFLQEARILWLRSLGYVSELDVDGSGLIQSDLQVQYIKEAFLGDVLTVELYCAEMDDHRLELCYRISNDQRLIAIAFTNLIIFDYARSRIGVFSHRFLSLVHET